MTKTKISLAQLENFLSKAADILRGSMESSEYKEFIFGILFIKRMSDEFDKKREELKRKFSHLDEKTISELLEDKNSYGDTFFVPKQSRWNEGYYDENEEFQPAIKDVKENIGERLNKAIDGIEDENDVLQGVLKGNIDFNKTVGKKRIKDSVWKDLIDHFNNPEFVLINENFEFPDLLGAAYEYLIKFFAESAGKKGGEFYTPSEVTRLLVQLIKPKEGMTVYDPTCGSGGMLIQSSQYVEEQGGDPKKLALYGQEKAGTVWSICMMNMILHNRPDAHIEHGDTIEEPLHKEGGTIKKFDRVIANPPFSQNYTRANVTFESRFKYGWAPETGKKADLMFVQHMIASLKQKGVMATIMPHGVLFRGGQEKIIREGIVNDDIIEAIIGLPPALFYGTGIPACVLVINKNKPDELKDKIFFINADAEYAEGKNQNKLRLEDIEKIDYVFTNKIEIPKYSRLVDKKEIIENDYNLNIRRYVDNTPEPEPEDVKAHLIGGIPKTEVENKKEIYKKFNFNEKIFFKEKNEQYLDFAINSKEEIKKTIEENDKVKETYDKANKVIETWWLTAKDDFAKLAQRSQNGTKIAEIRISLLNSIKKELTKVGVLDEFQSAGVFVNWWNNIKYDLKTITSSGWSPALIPDELIINTYFKKEQEEIEKIESELAEQENLLNESVESVDYEVGEEEKITTKTIIDYLTSQIKELRKSAQKSAIKEMQEFEKQLNEIKDREAKVKQLKKQLKIKQEELAYKIEVKREGDNAIRTKYNDLIKQAEADIKKYEAKEKDPKAEKERVKKIKNLNKDIETLKAKLSELDSFVKSIGGAITEQEAKELILKKHFDIITNELNRYLNQEKRKLISVFENLWDKYKTSYQELEQQRQKTMQELNDYLEKLGYYGGG
ncbi:MAG: type I restriction-modification system subunit M [Candidatus Aenigmatarchaeota archaeon]